MPKPPAKAIMSKAQALSALRFSMETYDWDGDLFSHILMILTQAGYPPIEIPDGYQIKVEPDYDYVPDGDYDLEEEREKLASGEWSVYVVALEKQCECGTWQYVDSLHGVVVESSNQDGAYSKLDSLSDSYLKHVACELIVEEEGKR